MDAAPGALYIVATPIGNLEDMTPRALETLRQVDRIAAEDTRHSQRLLNHFGIQTPMFSLHEHNERQRVPALLDDLARGMHIALISDAGTPLISDPGFPLVRAAREQGIEIIPIPGCSALICALSASGLPTDRFVFEGFLPAKEGARQRRLEALAQEPRTLVFYESSHRIVASLMALRDGFGNQRPAVVARELTKTFETIHADTLQGLVQWVSEDLNQQKGEFVILVQGHPAREAGLVDPEAERVLRLLLEALSVKQSAALAAKITGISRKALYERALQLLQNNDREIT